MGSTKPFPVVSEALLVPPGLAGFDDPTLCCRPLQQQGEARLASLLVPPL